MISRIRGILAQWRRVLLVASKPDKDEFRQSVKITGLGAMLIGAIGFVVFLAVHLIGGL